MLRTIKSQLLCQLSYAPFAREGNRRASEENIIKLITGACGWLRMSAEVVALHERCTTALINRQRFVLVQRFVSGNTFADQQHPGPKRARAVINTNFTVASSSFNAQPIKYREHALQLTFEQMFFSLDTP